jgi:hypothetical protein
MLNVSIYAENNNVNKNCEDDINQWKQKKLLFNELKQKHLMYGINFIDIFKTLNNNYLFIYEKFGESLSSIIDSKRNSKVFFSYEEVISITYQILIALNEFNENNIWLSSLHPQHIFLNKTEIKIQNHIFDLLFTNQINHNDNIQSIKYIPPEFLFFPNKQNNPSSSSPIWSLGIILLDMLSNLTQFSNYQDIMPSYLNNTNAYLNDYIDLLKQNINGTLINKNNINIDYNTIYPKDILSYYFQGKLVYVQNDNDNKIHDELLYFIKECLVIDCDNRKNPRQMFEHSLFKKYNKCIKGVRNNGEVMCLFPLDKETMKNKIKQSYLLYNQKDCNKDINNKQLEEEMISVLTIEDHYMIMKDILQIDIVDYLTKINVLQKSGDLLYIPELNYNINEFDNNGYNSKIKFKSNISITFPLQYNSINDLNENQYTLYFNTDILKKKALMSILNYIKLKRIVLSLFYRFQLHTKEDLINELKKLQPFPFIPPNLRLKVYCILLDINYFNSIDTSSLLPYINIKSNIPNYMNLISDINRSNEYSLSEETKLNIFKVIALFSLNNPKFFFVQGLDSIISVISKLTNDNINITYQIFNSFYEKNLLQNFYDDNSKSITDLKFHHLIISRLLLYYAPELYMHLNSCNVFDTLFLTNELLTLFSRTFSYEDLLYIWDIIIIMNINIIYMFIINMLIQIKDKLLILRGEYIHLGLKTFMKDINVKQLCIDSIELYKKTPHSFIPMFHDFNPTVIEDLKKNEYFKNRWWDLCDFYTDDIKVPVLTLEDAVKNYENIIFIDIRQENNNINNILTPKIKDALIYKNDTELDKHIENFNNKIILLVGNKQSEYNSIINILLNKKVKHICMLQGGIDIIQTDEQSLLI